jgi:hypothetical protein
MGWTYGWKTKGELVAHLIQEREGFRTVAHKSTSTGLYAVHELKWANGEWQRFIAVYLIERQGGDWGYKDMEESMGPYVYDCPLAFLDMVPEPVNGYAKEWREKVRAYHATKASAPR